MEQNNNYPKYQWSMFLNGKDEQVVVRGNIYFDFTLDVEAIKKAFTSPVTDRGKINPIVNKEPVEIPLETQVRYCSECNSIMNYKEGVGKTTGKPYKGFFCSKNCGAKPIFVGIK